MWDIAKRWSEIESIAVGIIGTFVTVVLVIIGRVFRFIRGRQVDDALEMAKEARTLAQENRVRIERNERRVSDCYGLVLSLQHDMAAMSHRVESSAEELNESSRVIKEYTARIRRIVEDSGLKARD